MGKRYYCDYCDKSFADNPVSRRTHLTGTAHLQNKKAHYDSLRDEKDILNDDKNMKPCRAFLSTVMLTFVVGSLCVCCYNVFGECKFGERCQYSHLTNEDRVRLSQIVLQREELAKSRLQEQSSSKFDLNESLGKWVEKRNKRQKLENKLGDESVEITSKAIYVPEYKLADCLLVFPSIPPSLHPPKREAILNCPCAEWGWS